MKKQLLCTSAIALGVAAAAPASAQEWDMDWGGFYSVHTGYADISGSNIPNNSDFDGVNIFNTGEIIFSPSVTMDNGLTFGLYVEYEAHSGASTNLTSVIDQTAITIEGDRLGKLVLGSDNSAGYKMMVGAPTVTTMWINSPSVSSFIPRSGSGGTGGVSLLQASISSYTEVGGNDDVTRITYYTPSFNGLVAGVSYARDATTNVSHAYANLDKDTLPLTDVYDIGLKYSQSFGSTDVTLAARWGEGSYGNFGVGGAGTGARAASAALDDPTTWGIGAQVSFGGLTVGASYNENDNGDPNNIGDQEGFTFGVTYDTGGPWSFEALTVQGESEAGPTDSDYETYKIGASRDIGPGVDWDLYVIYTENTLGTATALVGDGFITNGTGAAGRPGGTIEGTLVGTAINLNF